MIPGVEGKSVAVIGRAASLLGSRSGRSIDAQDVVVRVNWMLPLEGDSADIGERTDIVYRCHSCEGQQAAAEANSVPSVPVDRALRKALAKRSRLSHKKYRPTTGCVAIFDALASGAREVHAFGFDFYRSGYAAPAPPGEWGAIKWRHRPAEDRHLLAQLLHGERRFRPDIVLLDALKSKLMETFGEALTMKVLTTDVQGCARCGADHENLEFREMVQPITEAWRFWAPCPVTGDPILLTQNAPGGGAPPLHDEEAAPGA